MTSEPTRNMAMELVRVTEAAALSAGRWMGRGNKNAADHAAVEAMRLSLNSIVMNAVVVIGEGAKDEAPMLYSGERVGTGSGPEMDLAVDPIDGTRPLVNGTWNSISTVALAPRGAMFDAGPFVYMDKIAVGPQARGLVEIEAGVRHNLRVIARANGKSIEDLIIVILDRPRHEKLIAEVRAAGARIRLIQDGDVAGALSTAWPGSGIDALLGVGGSPEGVISACALRAMGGEIQGKLAPRNAEELALGKKLGIDVKRLLTMDDLVSSEDVFFAATGITDGEFLKGVKYTGHDARTDSLVVRGSTGTVRQILATHRLDKLERFSAIKYSGR